MSQYVEAPTKTFKAAAAIGAHILVKISSGKLAVCGVGEAPIGTIETEAFADLDVRSVRLLSAQGTQKGVAAGAFSAGAKLYTQAAGKIDDVVTSAIQIGVALEDAGAAGDIVEWMAWSGGAVGG